MLKNIFIGIALIASSSAFASPKELMQQSLQTLPVGAKIYPGSSAYGSVGDESIDYGEHKLKNYDYRTGEWTGTCSVDFDEALKAPAVIKGNHGLLGSLKHFSSPMEVTGPVSVTSSNGFMSYNIPVKIGTVALTLACNRIGFKMGDDSSLLIDDLKQILGNGTRVDLGPVKAIGQSQESAPKADESEASDAAK